MAPRQRDPAERLGAHVSTQGGVQTAPGRGTAIGATAIQVFTKGPSQWREPLLSASAVAEFRNALESSDIRTVISHDSYLINLASPAGELSRRSIRAFIAELRRCKALGIGSLVSHPGNYIDDRSAGLERNARNYTRCLRAVPEVRVLVEGTAGSGTALGSRFEELAELRDRIDADVRDRVGFCLDTCHLYSSGYDLIRDYDGVFARWERLIGFELLGCIHLNDSKTPFDSHCDRHQLIGEGSLGPEPFRRIMRDRRFLSIPKLLETPKGEDPVSNDRRMLRRLRAYARVPSPLAPEGSSFPLAKPVSP
jgi:deoxyribonuclease IV